MEWRRGTCKEAATGLRMRQARLSWRAGRAVKITHLSSSQGSTGESVPGFQGLTQGNEDGKKESKKNPWLFSF